MSTQVTTSTNKLQELAVNSVKDQYTLWQILGLWLAVSAPMGIMTWIVFPALRDRVSMQPSIFFMGADDHCPSVGSVPVAFYPLS